jgi:hypothetical protein
MRSICPTALLAVVSMTALPTAAHAQSRAEEALARRVDSLVYRMIELENRIAQIESARSQPPSSKTPAPALSTELANWRRLREDMTYDAVRRILGEPERIIGGTIAFWSYQNGGQVTFHSGRLTSWTEPPLR